MNEAVKRAMDAKAQLANLGLEASRTGAAALDALSEVIDDRKRAASKAIKRGRNAAEDAVEAASHEIKRAPLQWVSICLCAGAVIGATLALVVLRNRD
jgi:ElaB/YqjD/DUF883 family membrane-anchored ribosome-binding protein